MPPRALIRKCASLGQSVATKSNSPWTSIRMPPRGIHSVERILRDDARQANKRQRTSRGGTPTGERLVGACPVTHLSATDQPFEPAPSSNFGPRRGGGVNADQQRQRSERRHESIKQQPPLPLGSRNRQLLTTTPSQRRYSSRDRMRQKGRHPLLNLFKLRTRHDEGARIPHRFGFCPCRFGQG